MNRKDHCRISSGHPPSQSIKQGVCHEAQISSKWELSGVISLGPGSYRKILIFESFLHCTVPGKTSPRLENPHIPCSLSWIVIVSLRSLFVPTVCGSQSLGRM